MGRGAAPQAARRPCGPAEIVYLEPSNGGALPARREGVIMTKRATSARSRRAAEPAIYRATDEVLGRTLLKVYDEYRRPGVEPVPFRGSAAEFEPAGHAMIWFWRYAADLSDEPSLMVWSHFERANETFRKDFEYIELDGVNKYCKHQFAPTHVDNDQLRGSENRVLAMSIGLSELSAYDGGELVLDPGEPDQRGYAEGAVSVRLGFGEVLVFDASTRHRVNVVTAGERLAYVARVTSGPTTLWCRHPVTGKSPGRLALTDDEVKAGRQRWNDGHARWLAANRR
jgi:2OG-Fe(II) oxygenase superfamily